MAKRRRGRPKVQKPVKKTTESAPDLASLPVPNLNMLPVMSEDGTADGLITSEIYPPDPNEFFTPEELRPEDPGSTFWAWLHEAHYRFALTRLRVGTDRETALMAFYDPGYGCKYPPIGGLSPPTWMDPEVFVRQALESKELCELLDKAIAQNSYKLLPAIAAKLTEILKTEYFAYLEKRFNSVAQTLGCWFIARTVWQQEEKLKTANSRKK
jgi:hypothetical protein